MAWAVGLQCSADKASPNGQPSAEAWSRLAALVKCWAIEPPPSPTPSASASALTEGSAGDGTAQAAGAVAPAAGPASRAVVPALTLMGLLEPELLCAAGLVVSAESMDKKLKKLNTDAVYRQQKYNLLREESEG